MKQLLINISILFSFSCAAQQKGVFLNTQQNNCVVWMRNYLPSDSITLNWTGGCKNGKAAGGGVLSYSRNAKPFSTYKGLMQDGMPEGAGSYTFPGGITQEGNYHLGLLNGVGTIDFHDNVRKFSGMFKDGEFLDLGTVPLTKVHRQTLPLPDTAGIYTGGFNPGELLYFCVMPAGKVRGVIVLLPGTWGRVDYELSANRKLCEAAFAKGIAVLVLSVNQRLTLNADVLNFMNTALADATQRFNLPKDKFVIGGFSMGGLFAQRYTEMAYADSSKTILRPRAVYSVDGPTDLENMYNSFKRKVQREPAATEANYGIRELVKYTGGTPDEVRDKYRYYSSYTHAAADGGNAVYLKDIPVRIYNDTDVAWWLENRGADLYDMNALDQSAMINTLHRLGNTRATFINAFGKGYRLEGNRHPHAWSIVDAGELIEWVGEVLGD